MTEPTEPTEETKEERTQSPELKAIIDAIEQYCSKHDKVMFHAAFMAIEGEDNDIVDEGLFAFGPKEGLIINTEEILKIMKEEKEDFINW